MACRDGKMDVVTGAGRVSWRGGVERNAPAQRRRGRGLSQWRELRNVMAFHNDRLRCVRVQVWVVLCGGVEWSEIPAKQQAGWKWPVIVVRLGIYSKW